MKGIEILLPRKNETEAGWKRRVQALGYSVVRVGDGYGVTGGGMKMPGIPHDEEKGTPERVTKDVFESRAARERDEESETDFSELARTLAQSIMSASETEEGDDEDCFTADLNPEKKPETFVLDQAKAIVYGARQNMYGHASTNFRRTARLWEVVLGVPVTDIQVGLAMIQLKVARIHNLVEREAQGGAPATFDEIEDGFKDVAGYAEATMRARFERPDGSRTK